jgi:formimidoylglutamate deiminase
MTLIRSAARRSYGVLPKLGPTLACKLPLSLRVSVATASFTGTHRMTKHDERPSPARHGPRSSGRPPAVATPVAVKSGVPHGATETGWLPDFVYTGEKFEPGLAFFADAVGRIVRFSREPADLAAARRLEGQAALPGLVNTHSHSFQRVLRGRTEVRSREALAAVHEQALARLSDEDAFDTARMVFMEMLLSGITCVGEFHYLHHQPDGAPWADANHASREIMRAAHDVGIRIALLKTAFLRSDSRAGTTSAPARFLTPAMDQFLRETETLRVSVEKEFPADEAWLGLGAFSLGTVALDPFKALAIHARTIRMRLHAHVSTTADEVAASITEFGRTPIALLAEHGIVDKRFTAIDGGHLNEDEIKLLGAARASVCVCPTSALANGLAVPPVEKLLDASAGVAFGTDTNVQVDLLKDARSLELHLRGTRAQRAGFASDPVTALFHAATVTGARSLGATGGALEVGRPADFFTVSLYDPSIAGSDASSLLANILFSLERRAIRDVWVGARLRISNGRHVSHGPIVGRFVETQRRVWGSGG